MPVNPRKRKRVSKRTGRRVRPAPIPTNPKLAKAAGAALGYIAGGIPGAAIGYAGATKAIEWKAKYKGRKAAVVKAESTGLQMKKLDPIYMGRMKQITGVKHLGNYQYHNQTSWIIQGAQGVQLTDYTEILFTRDQLTGATSNSRTNRERWHDNPYSLNPFYKRVSSDIYTVVPPGTGPEDNDRLYIKNVHLQYRLLSLEKIPQRVTVYFLTPKFDTSVSPLDAWNNILTAKQFGQTAQTYAPTLATPTATAGYSERTDIGQNPFQHKEFRNIWESVKTVKIVLQAGEQVNFEFNAFYEKIVNRVTLLDNRQSQYLKGLTIYPIFIVNGGLVGISSAAGVESTEVAHGKTKVGVVSTHDIKFGALGQGRFSTARTFDGVIQETTEVMRIIDDNDNVADPEVEA